MRFLKKFAKLKTRENFRKTQNFKQFFEEIRASIFNKRFLLVLLSGKFMNDWWKMEKNYTILQSIYFNNINISFLGCWFHISFVTKKTSYVFIVWPVSWVGVKYFHFGRFATLKIREILNPKMRIFWPSRN